MKIFHAVAVCVLCFGLAAAHAQQAPASPNRSFVSSPKIEGQPNETRLPEKADNKPAFPEQTRAPYHASAPVQAVTVAGGLIRPWSVAVLPDGRYLVTEKAGALRMVTRDGVVSEPFIGIPHVVPDSQGGLLDVALDIDFPSNKRLFFTFTQAREEGTSGIAVARAILDEAAQALKNVEVIYTVQPAAPVTQSAQQGSRIAVANDGTLFISIGDRSTRGPWNKAQAMDTALGKVIRITADGAPAPGNPFLDTPGVLPEIWSVGHRNPQGIALDTAGELWLVEHGPLGGDELNLIRPGKNYGWPIIVRGVDYTGLAIGEGITEQDGLEQPVYYWDPVIAPSALTVYAGEMFPHWKGSILISALRGQQIARLSVEDGKVISEEPILDGELGRLRDIRVDLDGALVALTEDGRLLRIIPE